MPLPEDGESRLRDWCEEQVDLLHLPYRFSTRELREAISEQRGKRIILNPLTTLGVVDAPCGIRLETPAADLLFYEEGTSIHHQRHILTHELCHVYCDHPGSLEVDAKTVRSLGVNPTLVMRMSGRTSYSSADERQAEMMATVIRWRIYRDREFPSLQPEKGPDSWDALFAQPFKRGRFGR
ncbi:regulator component [Streptomyces cavernicola]|uniref:Regulator component n=1 Tax=Streptomyces cavernicola TaxID=3043613 RepID=A0ABT6SNW1_9ACTN|nr:regulator component [Streptomyces sp. B-S-A6]MDI3408926.1 regulator component [Streptomyces sp. B-S-A6]